MYFKTWSTLFVIYSITNRSVGPVFDRKQTFIAILKGANLADTSAKKVRQQLEEKLDTNLQSRKKEIDELVMEFVSSKGKKKGKKNESEDDDEGSEEEEDEVAKINLKPHWQFF